MILTDARFQAAEDALWFLLEALDEIRKERRRRVPEELRQEPEKATQPDLPLDPSTLPERPKVFLDKLPSRCRRQRNWGKRYLYDSEGQRMLSSQANGTFLVLAIRGVETPGMSWGIIDDRGRHVTVRFDYISHLYPPKKPLAES